MRTLMLSLPLLLTAAALASAASSENREWEVNDATTFDDSMTNPPHGPSVSCGANHQGIKARCSADSAWQSVPTGTGEHLRLSCGATDSGIEYVDAMDTELVYSISWESSSCTDEATWVDITGTLSNCTTSSLSHSIIC